MKHKKLLHYVGLAMLSAVALTATIGCADKDYITPSQADARVEVRVNELMDAINQRAVSAHTRIDELNVLLEQLQRAADDSHGRLSQLIDDLETSSTAYTDSAKQEAFNYADVQAEQARLAAIETARDLVATAIEQLSQHLATVDNTLARHDAVLDSLVDVVAAQQAQLEQLSSVTQLDLLPSIIERIDQLFSADEELRQGVSAAQYAADQALIAADSAQAAADSAQASADRNYTYILELQESINSITSGLADVTDSLHVSYERYLQQDSINAAVDSRLMSLSDSLASVYARVAADEARIASLERTTDELRQALSDMGASLTVRIDEAFADINQLGQQHQALSDSLDIVAAHSKVLSDSIVLINSELRAYIDASHAEAMAAIQQVVDSLGSYYTKAEVYTKVEVDSVTTQLHDELAAAIETRANIVLAAANGYTAAVADSLASLINRNADYIAQNTANIAGNRVAIVANAEAIDSLMLQVAGIVGYLDSYREGGSLMLDINDIANVTAQSFTDDLREELTELIDANTARIDSLAATVNEVLDRVTVLEDEVTIITARFDDFEERFLSEEEHRVHSVVIQKMVMPQQVWVPLDATTGEASTIYFPYEDFAGVDSLVQGTTNTYNGMLYFTLNPIDVDVDNVTLTLVDAYGKDVTALVLTDIAPATNGLYTRAASANGIYVATITMASDSADVNNNNTYALKASWTSAVTGDRRSVLSQYFGASTMDIVPADIISLYTSDYSLAGTPAINSLSGTAYLSTAGTPVYRKFIEVASVRTDATVGGESTPSQETLIELFTAANSDLGRILTAKSSGIDDTITLTCPSELIGTDNTCMVTFTYFVWNYDGTIVGTEGTIVFSTAGN